jgi:8-oxo-dGTP diphosphatase
MSHSACISSLSVDSIIFGFDEGELKILLIKRAQAPEKGKWALPGGFVGNDENLDDAAKSILEELTGLSDIYMEQLHTFGDVKRYPLGRVISIAYYSLIKVNDYNIKAAENAKEARWHPISKIPKLAFDHTRMVEMALEKLKINVKNHPIGFELLPEKFTLTQLQNLYEVLLNTALDKRNFRKKILSMDLLNKLEEYEKGEAHRAAQLFNFNTTKYEQLKSKGFVFEI